MNKKLAFYRNGNRELSARDKLMLEHYKEAGYEIVYKNIKDTTLPGRQMTDVFYNESGTIPEIFIQKEFLR